MSGADVIIIGGGPAGMTAAIQLKRYGLNPLLFESRRLGGLLWNANLVENYPGFPGGIPGPALVEQITRQFTDLGIRHKFETISEVDYEYATFLAHGEDKSFFARFLVLATGTRPNTFPSELIPPEAASRVFYEVHDLADLHNATVAIIGAGDAAFDYAINLARGDNQVLILNRGTEIKALPLLVDRVSKIDKITYLEKTVINKIQLEDEKLILSAVDGSGKTSYKVDALLGAIGRSPAGPAFTARMAASQEDLQQNGILHLIGDVHNGIYRQTAIAVGDGLKAAMKIYQFLLEEEKYENRS